MKKSNNKGFSLVELIVVVAIMAVLVGVLAPAYLKYVEKSRKSTDISTMDNIMEAMTISASDIECNMTVGDTMTASWDATGKITFAATGTNAAKVKAELEGVIGTNVTLKSADFKVADSSLVGTVGANGVVTFGVDAAAGGEAMQGYSSDFAAKTPNVLE